MNSTTDAIRQAFEQGDFERSLSIARDRLADNDDDGKVWEWAGIINMARHDYRAAINAFEHASLLVPIAVTSSVQLAMAYGKIGKTALAHELLESIVNQPHLPDDVLLYVASALDAVERPDLALTVCNGVVRRRPQSGQAYYDLGMYAARCGLPEFVVETLARKAIEIEPHQVTYRMALATWLAQRRRFRAAYEVCQQLTIEQLQGTGCRRCLSRLAEVFARFGDHRAAACRQRLAKLGGD